MNWGHGAFLLVEVQGMGLSYGSRYSIECGLFLDNLDVGKAINYSTVHFSQYNVFIY